MHHFTKIFAKVALVLAMAGLSAGKAGAYDFCALSISVESKDHRPAIGVTVELLDEKERVVFAGRTSSSPLKICDFGFGAHVILVDRLGCHPTRVAVPGVRPASEEEIIVIANPCWGEQWRTGCQVYLRVVGSDAGHAIRGAVVTSKPAGVKQVSDRYGRAWVLLPSKSRVTLLVSADGFGEFAQLASCASTELIDLPVSLVSRAKIK